MLKAFAGHAIFLLAAATASPSWALCALCTAEVRLDTGLADCFLQRSADDLKQLAAGKSFVIVDLHDCGSRGGLPTGAASDGPPAVLDDKFVTDAAGLKCLASQIAELDDGAMTPSHVFDLSKDCPAQ